MPSRKKPAGRAVVRQRREPHDPGGGLVDGLLGAELAPHVGLHEARARRVDLHAGVLELGGEDARHRVQRRLRDPVARRPSTHLGHAAHSARDVHHARVLALAQQRQQRDREPVGAEEVRVERPLDGVEVGLRAGDPEVRADPRVVHEHVERSRIVADRRRSALDRGRIGHVELERPAAHGLRGLARLRLVASGHDHVESAFGKLPGRLAADATVGAADEGNWHVPHPIPKRDGAPSRLGLRLT